MERPLFHALHIAKDTGLIREGIFRGTGMKNWKSYIAGMER